MSQVSERVLKWNSQGQRVSHWPYVTFFSWVLLLLCQIPRGWKQPTCWAFGSCGCEWAAIFVNMLTDTDELTLTDVINETMRESAAAILCTTGWHCSSSFLHHSLPPSLHALLFSLALFPCVSSSCVGGRLESPESTTRITRSISETISFSHLFYMVYPSISLSSLPVPLTHSLWLICVFTLCPSSPSLLLGM